MSACTECDADNNTVAHKNAATVMEDARERGEVRLEVRHVSTIEITWASA